MTAIYPKSSEFLNLHTVSDTLEVMKPSSGTFKTWKLLSTLSADQVGFNL